MTPPPLAPSLPPSVRARIEAQEAALREACNAAQQEREALEEARQEFVEEAANLAAERRHVAWSLEGELIDLAVAMAEALVGSIEDPSLAPRLAKEALACLPEADEATLRVGSTAFEAICDRHGATFTHEGTKVTLRLDDTLRGPGCLVESREAQVDARIHERLMLAARAMHEERAAGEERE